MKFIIKVVMELNTQKKVAAGLSITSNAVIILLKIVAGILSGSISIISEAIHSFSDFLASVLTFLLYHVQVNRQIRNIRLGMGNMRICRVSLRVD